MMDSIRVERRRHFCSRCNQYMFEYYFSPDGHFGLANFAEGAASEDAAASNEIACPKCRARYRLLDRLNGIGQPAERI